jgi:hypothetical protein
MWTIWGSRNSYNHGEVKYQPLKSMGLVDELIKALEIPKPDDNPENAVVLKWLKPEMGWMKINSDGALDLAGGRVGVGVIVRDHMGEFVVAECRKYEHITDPGTTELLACRDALMLAKARGWTHVVVETDYPARRSLGEERGAHANL